MRSRIGFAIVVSVGLAALVACHDPQRVQASNEEQETAQRPDNPAIHGDLHRIDVAGKTLVIRLQNGMAQTFKWDETTVVNSPALDNEMHSWNRRPNIVATMKQLSRHQGSEVSVEWIASNAEKMATSITVTDLAAAIPARRSRSYSR
jgi:hypothetical protein